MKAVREWAPAIAALLLIAVILGGMFGLAFGLESRAKADDCSELGEQTDLPTKVDAADRCLIRVDGEWMTQKRWENGR